MLKARNIQSTDTFKQVLSKLVNVVEPVDLFEWVSVLQFNNEKQLIPAIGKMLDDKQFLESIETSTPLADRIPISSALSLLAEN